MGCCGASLSNLLYIKAVLIEMTVSENINEVGIS
jgi:hypothetical protein